ncbi:hypothetical protein D3C80_2053710 [compost metagenome]
MLSNALPNCVNCHTMPRALSSMTGKRYNGIATGGKAWLPCEAFTAAVSNAVGSAGAA